MIASPSGRLCVFRRRSPSTGSRRSPELSINWRIRRSEPWTTQGQRPGFSWSIAGDQDVPPWTQLRTAGWHLALVRRVVDRRPDVHLIAFHRFRYHRWLGSRLDTQNTRVA
jgi:hypothetical protein